MAHRRAQAEPRTSSSTASTATQARSATPRSAVNGNQTQATGGAALPLDAWTHLAATYAAPPCASTGNATQVATFARSGADHHLHRPTPDRRQLDLAPEFFNGLVDEVRIYNRALTAAEITTDMNTPISGTNAPPTVSITAPAAGTTWKVGDPITFFSDRERP